jgi:hypothetical protein
LTLRMFKDLGFADWCDDEGITDGMLCASAEENDNGLIDARLFFLHGFAKKEKDNITQKEKAALTRLAAVYMGYEDATLADILADGDLLEIGIRE